MLKFGSVSTLITLSAAAFFASPSQSQSDYTISRQIQARLAIRYHNASLLKRSSRAENIRDEEVKELQAAIASLNRGFITSIGPVIVPCHCEEGPGCTAEVTVALQKAGQTIGINFSKIQDKWQLGLLEKWDLRYQSLEAYYLYQRFPAAERAKQQQAHAEQLAALLADMPQCVPNSTTSTPDTHPKRPTTTATPPG